MGPQVTISSTFSMKIVWTWRSFAHGMIDQLRPRIRSDFGAEPRALEWCVQSGENQPSRIGSRGRQLAGSTS
jgi:hypothetical protein